MKDLVVDASVALKWFVPEVNGDAARQLLALDAKLHAPRFLVIETANAAWKNWRKQLINESIVRSVGERLSRLVDTWYADDDLYDDAVSMALTLNHPIFDCLYLVLAQRLEVRAITADKRLLGVAPANLVIALTDWKP